MQIGTEYGEGYFEREEGSAYKNYTWKPDLIGLRLQAIIQTTGISPPDKVLDFGCAKGYYVKWLKQNGFDALGLDISTYAISQAPQDVRRYLRLRYKGDLDDFVDDQFDLTIAKDVLEHLTDYELEETINGLISISKKILVTVPITNSNGNYINPVDETDLTHKIRYTKEQWLMLLGEGSEHKELCQTLKGEKEKGTLCAIIS